MVLDLDLFRVDKGGDPERVRASVRDRFDDVTQVDRVIALDSKWRKCRHSLDQLNKAKNSISKAYGARMKALKGAKEESDVTPGPLDLASLLQVISQISDQVTLSELKSYKSNVDEQIVVVTKDLDATENERNEILREIGNLLHKDVPISNDEDENLVIRTSDGLEQFRELAVAGDVKYQLHVDLINLINGVDEKRGSAIAGSRGYFLKGPAVWLQQALISYSLRFAADNGFEPIYTPFWMKKSLMSDVAQLSQFDEELYKVSGKESLDTQSKDVETDDKYLIATSEQAIAALHRNEWLNPSTLPIKYAGLSTCFRKEAGSHGRDQGGIFRVHQFEKVEQFVISAPSKSDECFEEMIGNAEKFYTSLEIPYRVVAIVSGALNNAAAIKYDLEAWFPGSAAFRELVSVSNCTDYQSRRLQIRFGQTKKMDTTGQVKYVHMLNGTLCAISRTICALLEVHQTKDGIKVPAALQPFMPEKFKTFIPFVTSSEPVVTLNA